MYIFKMCTYLRFLGPSPPVVFILVEDFVCQVVRRVDLLVDISVAVFHCTNDSFIDFLVIDL